MIKYEYFPQILIKRIGSVVPEWIDPSTILQRSRYFDSRFAAECCIDDFRYFYKEMKNSKYKDFDCDILDARIHVRQVLIDDWKVLEGYKYDPNK